MALGTARQQHHAPSPHVFIGSSSAALPLAHKVRQKIGNGGEIVAKVWDENLLGLGGNVLDDLLRFVSSFDFAVLVLSADDFISVKRWGWSRKPSPRDNVIFELGLFMGVRGRKRTFAIVAGQNKASLKLPSDLDGYTVLFLDPDRLDNDSYFTQRIDTIRADIKSESSAAALSLLPSAALANGYFNNFLIPVYRHLRDINEAVIADEKRELHDGNYEIIILLPHSLEQVGIAHRDNYVKREGLFSYKFIEGKREYGFFVYPPHSGEIIRFADYPTTLRSSAEIIKIYLQEPREVGKSEKSAELQMRMEVQEITNFCKALEWLLIRNGSEVPGLKEKTRIQYID